MRHFVHGLGGAFLFMKTILLLLTIILFSCTKSNDVAKQSVCYECTFSMSANGTQMPVRVICGEPISTATDNNGNSVGVDCKKK